MESDAAEQMGFKEYMCIIILSIVLTFVIFLFIGIVGLIKRDASPGDGLWYISVVAIVIFIYLLYRKCLGYDVPNLGLVGFLAFAFGLIYLLYRP